MCTLNVDQSKQWMQFSGELRKKYEDKYIKAEGHKTIFRWPHVPVNTAATIIKKIKGPFHNLPDDNQKDNVCKEPKKTSKVFHDEIQGQGKLLSDCSIYYL